VCGAPSPEGWPAITAPFIAEYVLHAPAGLCRLCECRACGLRFFAERFTEDELATLYAEYRGPRYFAVRHRHESWYSEAINRGVSHRGDGATARRDGLVSFLRASGAPETFEAILDYGGDAGQLIPLELARQAFVFDISGVTPVAGVTRIAAASELRPGAYDLVLLTHVLEHSPEPLRMLRDLRPLARAAGLLYVEVPFERPAMALALRGLAGRAYCDFVRRVPPLLRAIDFYSSVVRVKAGVLPPLGFPKLSEHQNFFSDGSLRRACERSGFEVLRIAPVSTHGLGGPLDAIGCLARAAEQR
jgi:hypothetical protein